MTVLSFSQPIHQQPWWLCLCQVSRLTSPPLLCHHHQTQRPRDCFNFLLMTTLLPPSPSSLHLSQGGPTPGTCFLIQTLQQFPEALGES